MGIHNLRSGRVSMARLLALLAALLGVPWMSAGGQQVTIRLADSRERAAGAIVSALRGEAIVVRELANEIGVAELRLPDPGVYRFRIDRIGRSAFISDTFAVARSGRVISLTLPATPVLLPDVVAQGAYLCAEARGSGGRALVLWEEARKALLGSVMARGRQTTYEQRLFRRQLSLLGLELDRTEQTRRTAAARPFLTHAPEQLHSEGYVRPNPDGGNAFYAPDEDVLLSESFLEAHCFGLEWGTGERAGLAGLTFRPMHDRRIPDIEGTLWLDGETGLLRECVFSYTDLPEDVDFGGVGGRVAFARQPSGLWYVSAWSIKTPVVASTARINPGQIGRRFVVTGYVEEGGEARPVK